MKLISKISIFDLEERILSFLEHKSYLKLSVESEISRLRDLVFATPPLGTTSRFENEFQVRGKKKNQILFLIFVSYYISNEASVSFLIREAVGKQLLFQKELSFLDNTLLGKEFFLAYILEYEGLDNFFGNIIKQQNFENFRFLISPKLRKSSKPKKTVFRRGYKDQGSCPENPSLSKISLETFDQIRLKFTFRSIKLMIYLKRRQEVYEHLIFKIATDRSN